jgi:DNA-binding response OmpR family regulator
LTDGATSVRILVVEDEVKMAALLKRGLSVECYAVEVAQTAEDAVWLGTENAYDAVVLDVMLPDAHDTTFSSDFVGSLKDNIEAVYGRWR